MTWIFLAGYLLVFLAFITGALHWRRRSRAERKPFPDHLKLLRGPGESSLRILAGLDDRLFRTFILALLIPVVASGLLLWLATHLDPLWQSIGFTLTLFALFASLLLVARRLASTFEHWRNRHLGCFGERVVAEALDPLKAHGFRVFHDVPGGDDPAPFNIDHVLVGPAGVFALETKTRRQRPGGALPGAVEQQIIYDGHVLSYPWGEDQHGLEQAQRQARWLHAWLQQLLGTDTPVHPVLVFPGWKVLSRARGAVAVLSPAQIAAAVTHRTPAQLDQSQIDLIARQLDARCRDVEF